MRTGIGYDTHRLIPTIKKEMIPLGGVSIPCFYRVDAHSDGDVLLHALVDACLGALALGDIGTWYPDTAPENAKRSSCEFVSGVLSEIRKLGWEVNQLDANLILEEPKLGEYRDSIRQSLARIFNLELSQISVKAKTAEGLGPIGDRRALACHAVVTLRERNAPRNY